MRREKEDTFEYNQFCCQRREIISEKTFLPSSILHSSDSDLSDLEEPPPTLHLSQSRDVEIHRPISREEVESVARQPDQVETLVDEGVVHQSMEQSQKLSVETISKAQPVRYTSLWTNIIYFHSVLLSGKCTDAELLDLMLDLCQTPGSQQPSQSCYSTQTVAQSLAARMRRSQSTTSSSLFSSPPCSYSTPAKSTREPKAEETGSEEGREDLNQVAGMDFLNTSIHSPVSTLTSDGEDYYEDDEERVRLTATETQKEQGDDIAEVPTTGEDAGAFVTGDLQLGDTESGFQLSLDVSLTEEPNPIETGSSLSPDSMDMEGSFGKEEEISDSQFDIPCAQLPSSQEDAAVLSQSDTSDTCLKSEVCSDNDSVLDLSVLEDPLVCAEECPRAPAASILGPDVFSFSQFDSSSQIPPAQVSTSQRRKLLQLCSHEDVEDEGEQEEGETGDSEEDDDYWLSQQAWEDISSAQQQQRCAKFSHVS